MKRLTIYFLAIAVVGTIAISCSKSSDPAAPSIVGTWKYSGSATAGCTDPADNEALVACTGGAADCGQIVITSSGYTYTPPTGQGSPETGTYSISGSTLTSTPAGGVASSQTFTVNATTLTFSEHDTGSGCTHSTNFTRQ